MWELLKTLENSLNVLKKFDRENPSWGVRELARETNVNHSVVHRILKTFEKHGFLRQNSSTKKYELGIKFLEYGMIAMDLYPINDQTKSIMKNLRDRVDESIFLTWIDGYDGLCVDYAESKNTIKFTVDKGSRTPLYAGANNRVLLAFQSEDYIDDVIAQGLKPITEYTITDPDLLKKDLQEIRKKGYAYTVGEFNTDVTGLAIPLYNRSNKVVASLTIAGPSFRIDESKIEGFLKELKMAGQKIEPLIEHYDDN